MTDKRSLKMDAEPTTLSRAGAHWIWIHPDKTFGLTRDLRY